MRKINIVKKQTLMLSNLPLDLETEKGREAKGCDTLGSVAMNERGGNFRGAKFIMK